MHSKIVLNIDSNPNRKNSKARLYFLLFLFLLVSIFSYGFHYALSEDDDFPTERNNEEIKGEKDTSQTDMPNNTNIAEDVEVEVTYKEELDKYVEDIIFFLDFTDTLYAILGESNIESETAYMELLNQGGINCSYQKYEGNKDILLDEILIKINNLEELMGSFCKEIAESSELMLLYKETTDIDMMLEYSAKVREINGQAYKESLLIRRICEEVESIIN